ncbi:MAG: hypothetical protein ACP5O7_06710 [Phycisphaerae bacterium]
MANRVWISYDLGVDGDYEGIYRWLDNQEAVECGDSCASLLWDKKHAANVEHSIVQDLKQSVKLRARDRIYLICKDPKKGYMGKFIFGKRKKSAPWIGYATSGEHTVDEG